MRKKRAFTLIELLIVVAIIGILAAVAVPNFLNAQLRAQLAQVESNVKALATAYELYRVDYGSYALHDTSHQQNVLNNAITTPIAYIATMPVDIFQEGKLTEKFQLSQSGAAELHPEPFYGNSFGNPAMDGDPNKYTDLTLRFKDDPIQYQKAQGMWPLGRYVVSVGPDGVHNFPGVFNASNGIRSSGDIIRVIP